MTLKRLPPAKTLEETIDAKFNALLNRLDEADVNGVKPPLNHVSGALTAAVAGVKIKRRLDEPDELGARGLYQKGAVLLEMTLAQRNAVQAPRVVQPGGAIPGDIIKHMRRHSGS